MTFQIQWITSTQTFLLSKWYKKAIELFSDPLQFNASFHWNDIHILKLIHVHIYERNRHVKLHIYDLVQDCSNSGALAMELVHYCAKPSTCPAHVPHDFCPMIIVRNIKCHVISLSPVDAYMSRWNGSSMFWFIAWCLLGSNQLSEPKPTCFQFDCINKMHFEKSSSIWWPFCPRLNVPNVSSRQ